jgi:hypothetical protein
LLFSASISRARLYCRHGIALRGTSCFYRGKKPFLHHDFIAKLYRYSVKQTHLHLKLYTYYPLRTVRPIYMTGVPLPSKCCILYFFFSNYKY